MPAFPCCTSAHRTTAQTGQILVHKQVSTCAARVLHRQTTKKPASLGSTWVKRDLQHSAVAANVREVAGVVVLERLGDVAEALGGADRRDAVRIEESGQIGALLRRHLHSATGDQHTTGTPKHLSERPCCIRSTTLPSGTVHLRGRLDVVRVKCWALAALLRHGLPSTVPASRTECTRSYVSPSRKGLNSHDNRGSWRRADQHRQVIWACHALRQRTVM